MKVDVGHPGSKVTEEPNQDNEWDGHAQEQEQNGTHWSISVIEITPVK
jgi:hypothetical protein